MVVSFLRKHRLLTLSILSGLLLSLSWPSRGVPLLIFVALVPLLLIEDKIFAQRQTHSSWQVLLYAWLGFGIFNILTTWWIVFASVPGLIMAIVLNSLFMAIAFWLMHLARRVLPGKQGPVSLLVFWLSFEYLHLDWDLSWSWLNLGNVFASSPQWVQWYEYTGVLGGTAWVLVLNLCFFALFKAWQTPLQTITVKGSLDTDQTTEQKHYETFLRNLEQYQIIKRRAIMGLVSFAFLVVPPVISLVTGKRVVISEETVEVVVVQPGRDPYLRLENALQARQWTEDIIALADQQITGKTRWVVAPEAAFPGSLWLNHPSSHYGFSALEQHAQQFDSLAWVAGFMMYYRFGPDEETTQAARAFHDGSGYFEAYNAALLMRSDGEFDTYFKSKLVPGIERMPFARYLKLLGQVVEYFGGTAGSMGTQPYRGVFTGMDGTKVAPVICYESIYGAYLNEYIRNGAQLIFVITNDGWWRDTPGYRQHNQYARLRAIETRRSIARAAKTGISGFIDPMGEFYQQTPWWEPAAIRQELPLGSKITFYVKHGDYLGRMAVFLLILLLLYMGSQALMRKKGLAKK